ncbi:MAG: IS1380 family transposase [Pyrinomonadaceae bacterium]
MTTECTTNFLNFKSFSGRKVAGVFDGVKVSSDGGILLLRELEDRTGVIRRLAGCFRDFRMKSKVRHSVGSLVGQRVFGLALGYEDLSDHDTLREDSLLGFAASEITEGRMKRMTGGLPRALAGKSTLNRLELTPADADGSDRSKKIAFNPDAADRLLTEVFMERFEEEPEWFVLDVDATDDPLHGNQEGAFYHGCYKHYCYLPLYIFADGFPLCARLRTSDKDPADGALEELQRIIRQIRGKWKKAKILVRGDGGFCRDEIMSWCESERGIYYCFGFATNQRLLNGIASLMETVSAKCAKTGKAQRRFAELKYKTLKSWSRERRVVAKAECLPGKQNPRFVVTSLPVREFPAKKLYEKVYCARGDMENRIKEQQLWLFADRTSAETLHANQMRLYFSTFAYLMLQIMRTEALVGTELDNAQCGTIRTKLLKIGTLLKISCRRILISFAESFPHETLFRRILAAIQQIPPPKPLAI